MSSTTVLNAGLRGLVSTAARLTAGNPWPVEAYRRWPSGEKPSPPTDVALSEIRVVTSAPAVAS
jgi:hypothetical protein